MKALIVLDCQKGMLARGDFDLLRENILKLQEMFKASGDLIIHTRHIAAYLLPLSRQTEAIR